MNRGEIINNIRECFIKCIPVKINSDIIKPYDNQYFGPLPQYEKIFNFIYRNSIFDEYYLNFSKSLSKIETALKSETTKIFNADTRYIRSAIAKIDLKFNVLLSYVKRDVCFDSVQIDGFDIKAVFTYPKYQEKIGKLIESLKKLLDKQNHFVIFNNLFNLKFSSPKVIQYYDKKDNLEDKIDKLLILSNDLVNKNYCIGILDSGKKEFDEMSSVLFEGVKLLFFFIKPEYEVSYIRENKSYDAESVILEAIRKHYSKINDLIYSDDFLCEYSETELNNIYENIKNFLDTYKDKDFDESLSRGENKLRGLVGLTKVKESVSKIKAFIKANKDTNFSFHMAFLGNPGTGKTEVARIIADILFECGALPRNQVVEVDRSGLVSQYVGETAQKTKNVIEKAMGGVLFIDEAYALDSDGFSGDYGNEAIATLIKAMEDYKGKFCVILAGYDVEMKRLIASNPGFKSRIQFILNFDDFNRQEIFQISHIFLSKANYSYNNDVINRICDITDVLRKSPNFANARTVRNIIEGSIMCQNVRVNNPSDKTITLEDINKYIADNDIVINDNKKANDKPILGIDHLNQLIGLETVKRSVKKIRAFALKNSLSSDFNLNMCFTGNPGTGKTEVARIISEILFELGVIKEAKLIETDASGLISKFVGQTQEKTKNIIDKAMGGVLFIDEAYMLYDDKANNYGNEAIATLLKEMEDRRGKICIILAGYKNEMKKLLESNPGFESRIQFNINFPDYEIDELVEISKRFIDDKEYYIEDDALAILKNVIEYYKNQKNFANARTVRNIVDQVILNQNLRTENVLGDKTINSEDVLDFASENNIEITTSNKEISSEDKILYESLLNSKKNYCNTNIDLNYLKQSVISISGSDSGEGTGFIITSDGYALTCAHCIADDISTQKARIILSIPEQGDIPVYLKLKLIKIDKTNDIALIKLVDSAFKFKYLSLDEYSYKYEPLKEFIMAGYPFGGEEFSSISITDGKIASVNSVNGRKAVFSDMFGKPGNSGSPIIEKESKKVIGIYWGGIGLNNEMINCFTPLDVIYDQFLKGAHYE